MGKDIEILYILNYGTQAEAMFRAAIGRYPGDYRTYNTLALYLQQNGQGEEAFKQVGKSLTLDINQQEAYIVLNEMYQGQWSQLRSKAADLSDQKIAAMLIFYSYYMEGDYPKAASTYDEQIDEKMILLRQGSAS